MIVLCECSSNPVTPTAARDAVAGALQAGGKAFVRVPDLCRAVARRSPALQRLAGNGPLTIVACHPRAVSELLRAAGVPVAGRDLLVLNMRSDGLADLVVRAIARPDGDGAAWPLEDPADPWVPWFPVIDYGRCQHCRQCLSFCLFGVYDAAADGRVVVANPSNCKTNCPACARICPTIAIMFPKFGGDPINGAAIVDELSQRERVRIDVEKILGENPYAALAARRAKRRLLVQEQASGQAAARQPAAGGGTGSAT